MQRPRYSTFGPFLLDLADERLWRRDSSVPLGNKAFAVLARLVRDPNQLVTKDDLLASVWPDTAVGEAVLTTAVREIRSALGDAARAPRFVETVYGRGYRFIAPVTEGDEVPPASGGPARTTHGSRAGWAEEGGGGIVGRDRELGRLGEWYASAQRLKRRTGLIAGEAGIGKSALVDAFLARVSAESDALIGRGQCIEQYGAGEAYMPILEALGRLTREPDAPVARVLHARAPNWLPHLPSASADATPSSTPVRPERMLRELAEALDVAAAERPLVLVLEDLHWSDRATLDWLAYTARRRDPARLLILGTYRPVEALLQHGALRDVLPEIRHQAQTTEIVLDYLSRDAVRSYLRQRCGDLPGVEALVDVLHRRTGGHPLFLASIVDELQGASRTGATAFDLHSAAHAVPLSVRQFIEHRIERLPADDQAILEAASVAGDPFPVAAVAAGTAIPEEQIEARCAAWSQEHRMLIADGITRWPDGTLGARYLFRHALFHETAYARISPERRARLHQLVGTRLEAAYGRQTASIAAELAVHFEQGRDMGKAVGYLEQAARNAIQRSAYHEAERHLSRAHTAVHHLVAGRERIRREATLSLLLGHVLEARQGWGAEEVARAYARARELCLAPRDEPRLLQATWGLIAVSLVRAELRKTELLARELLALAKRRKNTLFRMAAHAELGGTALLFGHTASAHRHFCLAAALDGPAQHRSSVAAFGVNLGIFARMWSTHAMWQRGCADRARDRAAETLAAAGAVGHPFTYTIALAYAALLAQLRRDAADVSRLTEVAIAHATEHGFPYYRAWAEVLRGWSQAAQGAGEDAVDGMRRAIDVLKATAGIRLPYYRALFAEACARAGRLAAGFEAVAEAFDDVRRTDERWWEAELHRTRGELLCLTPADTRLEAESCFRTAIDIARQQGARALELRAVASLARLQRGGEQEREARLLLGRVYRSFTEGFDTADLRDARALLDA